MKKNLDKVLINKNKSIGLALKKLNKNSMQILFVVGNNKKLLGTITDGDIRRGFINKLTLNDNVEKIYNKNFLFINENLSYENAKLIMQSNSIRCLPILDKEKKIINFFSLEQSDIPKKKNIFLIMAGGFGKRLLPITRKIPKPMLKIGNKPILEHIITKAKNEGFENFIISVHYLSKKIIEYFKDGEKFGVKISYIKEKVPLGTAGALRFLKKKTSHPIIVCNGDVLSDISFSNLLNFHTQKRKSSDMTVAIRRLVSKSPYGVIKLNETRIVGFEEKMNIAMNINAGIYIINHKLLNEFNIKKIDMSDYISLLVSKKKRVYGYKMNDNWIDIGTKENLNMSRKLINT